MTIHPELGKHLMTVLDRVNPTRGFTRFWRQFSDEFRREGGLKTLRPGFLSSSQRVGKIGLKQEAAGKMRVFAMVDPITQ
jgi:hypothetical protein